jgi:PAS domain S-box-containing protein
MTRFRTEQESAPKAIAEREAQYRLIAENLRDVILRADLRGRIDYASHSVRKVLGFDPEDLIGSSVPSLVHPDDFTRMTANIDEMLRGDFIPKRERRFRYRCKDGDYRWLQGMPSRIEDEHGNLVALVTCLRDITEQQAAEEALAASEARYRLLADNMTDLMVCSGEDGILTFVSGAAQKILGYEPAELIGRDGTTLVHPDDRESAREQFRRSLDGPHGEPFRAEYRTRRKDGSYVWVEAHPRGIFDAEGRFVEWQGVVRDITPHKLLEEQLKLAHERADAAAQTKAEILADMGHEIRGPLHSMLGFARLARNSAGLEPPVCAYVAQIEEACRGLLAMVDDILEFSLLEAARVAFRPRPFAVADFARSVLGMVEPQARAKNIELVLADATPPDLIVNVDGDRLRQVVLNLLGNALKFTHVGKVTLEICHDPAIQRLHISVRDTGPGIPVDQLGQLFVRFTQAGERTSGGAGLGLAICKRLVEGMGGEIRVESEPGRGSCFDFWVSATPSTPDEVADHADKNAPRMRVLVADADPAARETAVQALTALGAEVLTAADNQAAVALATREPVDVIVADLALAGQNGRTFLRRMRARRGPNSTTPVLALSDSHCASMEHAIEIGFQGLVDKPLSPPELTSAIADVLSTARQVRAP